jgi:hypothetical protein
MALDGIYKKKGGSLGDVPQNWTLIIERDVGDGTWLNIFTIT